MSEFYRTPGEQHEQGIPQEGAYSLAAEAEAWEALPSRAREVFGVIQTTLAERLEVGVENFTPLLVEEDGVSKMLLVQSGHAGESTRALRRIQRQPLVVQETSCEAWTGMSKRVYETMVAAAMARGAALPNAPSDANPRGSWTMLDPKTLENPRWPRYMTTTADGQVIEGRRESWHYDLIVARAVVDIGEIAETARLVELVKRGQIPGGSPDTALLLTAEEAEQLEQAAAIVRAGYVSPKFQPPVGQELCEQEPQFNPRILEAASAVARAAWGYARQSAQDHGGLGYDVGGFCGQNMD